MSDKPANPVSVYEAFRTGQLDWHISQGIIRTSVIHYCRLYERYKQLREEGMNYTEAAEATADQLSTSPETVRRAIAAVV